MEDIDNLLQIYEKLRSCSNTDEVQTLKKSLKGSIHIKNKWKKSDRDSSNVGKSLMLSLADERIEVDDLIKDVDNLIKDVHKEMQFKFPTSNSVGEKFESYMKEILDLLTKNKTLTIGVWGMGGVGKTTLTRHLHNMMLIEPHIYGPIYWITVSKECSIQKLQNDIAKSIGVSISYTLDESKRAGIIAKALERKEKFVLILDDMWSDFYLNDVRLGIPKEIGYRLIVTSRLKDVCLKMHCDKIVKVAPLSKKDAWTLFDRSIGREIPGDLTKISTDVLKECGGLPLGIITLAKSMIGCNDVCEWRNVLDELRNSSGEVDDMDEKVFKVLRWSYERLQDSKIKECLLYCATYPEDYPIEINKLIWLLIDAGLLGKNVGMAKMFDKGLAILKNLERAALLSIEGACVRLHDLIRDMALQITCSRFMIKADIGLKDIPDEESWTNQLEVVSLMRNQIEEISNSSPKCNGLTTLLLKESNSLSMICDGFFRHLDGLKLLELSNNRIKTLPESISLLTNLTALILRNCMFLKNVPSLAKLISLEKLDLYASKISQLPKGIGSLIKLRYLNLWNTDIRRIGVGVISKLTALQYLAIHASIDVKEFDSLNSLEHLSVRFEDFFSFSTFIEQMRIKGRPNSYNFILGNRRDIFLINEFDPIDPINQWVKKQIYIRGKLGNTDIKNLAYRRHNSLVKSLFGNYDISLEHLFFESRSNLQKCTEIERRVKVFCENELQKLLQDVHKLDIFFIDDLMCLGDFVFDMVCNLQIQSKIGGPKPFSNLKSLKFSYCENLKKLFPLGLLSNLQNIEEIIINACDELEELIESEDDGIELGEIEHPQIFSLPKLRAICLKQLPNLERLCSDDKVIRTSSLKMIEILKCPKSKRMPLDVDNQFPQMTYLKYEEKWREALAWDPPQSKSRIRFFYSLLTTLAMCVHILEYIQLD